MITNKIGNFQQKYIILIFLDRSQRDLSHIHLTLIISLLCMRKVKYRELFRFRLDNFANNSSLKGIFAIF